MLWRESSLRLISLNKYDYQLNETAYSRPVSAPGYYLLVQILPYCPLRPLKNLHRKLDIPGTPELLTLTLKAVLDSPHH